MRSAGENDVARQESAESDASTERIGVVFVHGVGSQTQSATLRENAQPLIEWLHEWHDRRGKFGMNLVSSVLFHGEERLGPPRLTLSIPPSDGRPHQMWVLSEVWWAPRIAAPRLDVVLRWGSDTFLRILGRLFWRTRVAPALVRRRPAVAVLAWIDSVVLTLWYVVAVVLVSPLAIVLSLISQLPIPGLDRLIIFRLLRPLLIEGVGDFYVYLHDEIQALHARSGVAETISWLVNKEQCSRVVVAAHSGGAVVAYDALGCRGVSRGQCVHDTLEIHSVDGLVTFGGAINPARAEADARRGRKLAALCQHTRWIDVWAAYDPVAAGPITSPPTPLRSIEVTNTLQILFDHGGYFTNYEEFTRELAHAIRSPAKPPPTASPEELTWVERRQDRVAMLALWRLIGRIALPGALAVRLLQGQLLVDGVALLATVGQLPVIGGVVQWTLASIGERPEWVWTTTATLTAIVAWGVACSLLYLVVTRAAYDAWAAREGRRSAGGAPAGPQALALIIRTVLVTGALVALASAVATFQLGNVGLVFVIGLSVVVWNMCWSWVERRADDDDRRRRIQREPNRGEPTLYQPATEVPRASETF